VALVEVAVEGQGISLAVAAALALAMVAVQEVVLVEVPQVVARQPEVGLNVLKGRLDAQLIIE
jgi:hypothetical protein